MAVTARRFVRRMRGGSQAQLLEGDDGAFYVTKFVDNPQHRRVLINEWMGAAFLRHLGIPGPSTEIIDVPAELLDAEPSIAAELGNHRRPYRPGRQFGSAWPGDPNETAVYDFLPDALLCDVVNLNHFPGALAFDRWAGNSDARQAVYFRALIRTHWREAPVAPARKGFLAWMIDHGYLFDGPHWDFVDSPLQGLYHRKLVYDSVTSLNSFDPWIARIEAMPESVADEAVRQMPSEWIAEDHDALNRLLERLWRRRKRTGDLLWASAKARSSPFAHWTGEAIA